MTFALDIILSIHEAIFVCRFHISTKSLYNIKALPFSIGCSTIPRVVVILLL